MNLYVIEREGVKQVGLATAILRPDEVFVIADSETEAEILSEAFVLGTLEPKFNFYKGLEIYGLKQ